MMNAKVRELGGTDSHFVNANGLQDEEHYTSAYDMALVGRAFAQNEVLLEISGTPFYHIAATPAQKDDIDLRHHHAMLPGCQRGTSRIYEYAIGGKNGFTVTSRQTLVTFAKKDGHRLVCVVMKEEKPNHYLDSTSLFNYGFACYENPSVKALIDAKAEELNPVVEEETADGGEQTQELTPEEREERENRVDSLTDRNQAGMDEADGQEEGKTLERKKSGGISILTIIVGMVVLAAVVICGLILYRSCRREQERRRRQAEIMARHRARKRWQGD